MAKITYPALVERAGDGGVGISFPDLPGCISAAETDSLTDMMAAAEEALALHVAGMVEDGDPLPCPSSIHGFGPEDVGRDYVTMLFVSVDAPRAPPVENVRVNVIVPKPVLDRIDGAVARLGMNRSSFLVQAAQASLRNWSGGGGEGDIRTQRVRERTRQRTKRKISTRA